MEKKSVSILMLLFILFLGNTSIQNSIAQEGQNDANSGQDAPGQFDNSLNIQLDMTYNGSMGKTLVSFEGGEDGVDNYYLDSLNAEGYLTLFLPINSTTPANNYLAPFGIPFIGVFYLVGDQYDFIGGIDGIHNYTTNPIEFSLPIIRNDPIGFSIEFNGDLLDYSFQFSFLEAEVSLNDGGYGIDAPDFQTELQNIPEINIGQTVTGYAGNWNINDQGRYDSMDTYRINIQETGFLSIPYSLIANSELTYHPDYDDTFITDGLILSSSKNEYNLRELRNMEILTYPITAGGDYLVKWRFQYLLNVSYTFTVNFEPNDFEPQNDGDLGYDAPLFVGTHYNSELMDFGSFEGEIGNSLHSIDGSNDTIDSFLIPNIYNGTFKIEIEFLDSDGKLIVSIGQDICNLNSGEGGQTWWLYEVTKDTNTVKTITGRSSEEMGQDMRNCSYTSQSLFNIRLITEDQYIKYRITTSFESNIDISDEEDSQELTLDLPGFIGFLMGVGLGIFVFGSIVRNRSTTLDENGMPKELLNQLIEVFGNSTLPYIALNQNFHNKEEDELESLPLSFPSELLKEKLLLHPVRLGIFKLLEDGLPMKYADLRSHLGINWGEFSNHAKMLEGMGYVRIFEQFEDGIRKQMICLETSGISKYHYLVSLLREYLDEDVKD